LKNLFIEKKVTEAFLAISQKLLAFSLVLHFLKGSWFLVTRFIDSPFELL